MDALKRCERCGQDLGDIIAGTICPACIAQLGSASWLNAPETELPPREGGKNFLPEIDPTGSQIGRYRLLQKIGEGGFGVVFLAEQEQPVRRRVALKIIKAGMDTKEVIARFEAERQALALMDHPNIAKVFDAGMTDGKARHSVRAEAQPRDGAQGTDAPYLSSGRPYFVMELVQGVPITDYCDQCHLATRERLELFITVCQAVQHAHQKGVIHRDLKPSNVLVSMQDGRPSPKIIDFGVAKAINQRLTEHTLVTAFAQMVGTPMYMSPEQAELCPLGVDTRSDIYSLGVLLYQLLTSTTPFDAKRLKTAAYDELRRIIREEEPPRPSVRISTLGADKATTLAGHHRTDTRHLIQTVRVDLDWIVMRAIEKDPTRRYQTASSLAADTTRYLHQEPVEACPPSAAYRLRKFGRRNRQGLAIAGLSVLALLTLAGSFLWNLRSRELRQAQLVAAINQTLDEVAQWEEQGNWPNALAAAKRAQSLLSTGEKDRDLARRVDATAIPLALLERLEQVRVEKGSRVRDNKFDYAWADGAYAETLTAFGMELSRLTNAVAGYPESVRTALASALDDWAVNRRAHNQGKWTQLVELAQEIDPDPWRSKVRWAWAQKDKAEIERAADSAVVDEMTPAALVLLSSALNTSGNRTRAISLLRTFQRSHPGDFWINHQLAFFLMDSGQSGEAVGFFRAALALRPDSPGTHLNLGTALLGLRKWDEAAKEYLEALRLKPDYTAALSSLLEAYLENGKLGEAEKVAREAIRLRPEDGWSYYLLGRIVWEKDDPTQAIALLREAVRLKPDDAQLQFNVALQLWRQGNWAEAEDYVRQAVQLKPDYAQAHVNLGLILDKKGDYAGAETAFREAIRLKPDLTEAYENLGGLLCDRGHDYEGAKAVLQEGIRLAPLDDKHIPHTHFNLGNVLRSQDRPEEAEAEYREAIRLQPDYAAAYNQLGLLLADRKLDFDAEAALRKSIRLLPVGHEFLPYAHANLGNLLLRLDRLEEAEAEYREAIRLQPDDAAAYRELGALLHDRKHDYEGARAAFQEGIRLAPDNADLHFCMGNALWSQEKPAEAEAEYREAIRLQPDHAKAHWYLGDVLEAQGRTEEAVGSYREYIHLRPGDNAYYEVGFLFQDRSRSGKPEKQADIYTKAAEQLANDYAADLRLRYPNRRPEGDALRLADEDIAKRLHWVYGLSNATAFLKDAAQRRPEDHRTWITLAAYQLFQGEADGYRRTCREMLERYAETGDCFVADRILKAFHLQAQPLVPGDHERLEKLMAVAASDKEWFPAFFQLLEGLHHFRCGRLPESMGSLKTILDEPNLLVRTAARSVAALDALQTGDIDAASRHLLAAEEAFHQIWPDPLGKSPPFVNTDTMNALILYHEAKGQVERFKSPSEARADSQDQVLSEGR